MRRLSLILIVSLLLIPITLAQEEESVVLVSQISLIEQTDLGLEALSVSPNGEDVLVVGTLGFAHYISGTDPIVDVELNTNDDDTLFDVDWHPQGLTALIVGDNGTMVRYTRDDHSISHVPGSIAHLMGLKLNAVSWDSSGNWAYIGGDNGLIVRFREDGNGNTEFVHLNGSRGSNIVDLSCHHQMHSICVIVTESDGIAVIDQQHEIHWVVGSEGTMWRAVECPHDERARCFAVAQQQSLGVIELNIEQPSLSFVASKYINIGAEFTGIHARDSGHVLLQTAPFGWVDWDIMGGDDDLGLAYPWLNNVDIKDPSIGGDSLVGGWSVNSDTGYGITSFGRVIYYYPPANSISDNLVSSLAPLLVIIAVPGVVIGLIYMSSSKLQKKYLGWSKARRAAKRAKK